ncbi:MAG: DUF1801 domain-containing protein [bacterium]|nr:DUF1801 domain-containing protein [bacterium]
MNTEVSNLFAAYSEEVRNKLLAMREMIFDVAKEHDEIGEIVETVKWNVPSYLTVKPKSGITIRLDPVLRTTEKVGIYVHCQSFFIEGCKTIFGDFFEYDGKRGILINLNETVSEEELRRVFYLALTYHLKKT